MNEVSDSEQKHHFFDSFSKWGSFLTPFGIVLLLVLQSQFVSRKEFTDSYDKMDIRVQKIEIALVQLVEQNKINDRQDVIALDHEKRIRDLEHLNFNK
jgi:hypothetical protein